jgi:hypothetical protein
MAMTAWIGARSLSQAAFEERFIVPSTSSAAVGNLRAAAEGVRTARTHQDLAHASAELAGAMRGIGLEKWPGFLKGAAEQADAHQPAGRPVMLAQVATPHTATEASSGGDSAAAAAPGRYVADDPQRWIGQNSVGTGECVPLVQAATGAPLTRDWRLNVPVQGNTAIRRGAAIATSDGHGHYAGHAAIYLWQDEHGIHVIDQWNRRDSQGRVVEHMAPHERTLPLGDPNHARIDRGEFYYVVE